MINYPYSRRKQRFYVPTKFNHHQRTSSRSIPNVANRRKTLSCRPFVNEEACNPPPNLICEVNELVISLHHPDNPVMEASQILMKLENEFKKNDPYVIFFGVGLGYHIKQFTSAYPNIPYSIFEPSAKIMHTFLSSVSMSEINLPLLRNISIGTADSRFSLEEIKSMLYQIPKSFTLITLPSYLKLFQKSHGYFIQFIQHTIKQKQLSLGINHHFEKNG